MTLTAHMPAPETPALIHALRFEPLTRTLKTPERRSINTGLLHYRQLVLPYLRETTEDGKTVNSVTGLNGDVISVYGEDELIGELKAYNPLRRARTLLTDQSDSRHLRYVTYEVNVGRITTSIVIHQGGMYSYRSSRQTWTQFLDFRTRENALLDELTR